jgi:two-component system, cell cycle sensor histidine kinase and response regulator CckA
LIHTDEKRYRELVENLNDIVYATDTNANITYVSPNITRIGGYLPEEVLGRNFTEFVHPDDLHGRLEQFRKIISGATQSSEYRFLSKAGQTVWVRTSARAIVTGGGVVGLQGVLVVIDDRKAAEEALRRSEEKYRILVENARDAIFVIQDQRVRFANASAAAIVGYSSDVMANEPFESFIHLEDRAAIMDRHRQRLAGKRLPDPVCFRILARDNVVKHVNLNAVLIEWEGKPAVLSFLRDITTQVQMEEKLRHSQKLEALGTLSGGIAHKFNNLLMGIQGNASLSMIRMDPTDLARAHLEKIVQLVQDGARLTQQLLQYARGGHQEVGPVDLNHLVRDVSATLAAAKKQGRIRQLLAEDLPCIEADKQQIAQAVFNLLLNAVEAMPESGDVCIETAAIPDMRAVARPGFYGKGPFVLLKVTDTGKGMSSAVLQRIFEPFFTTKGLERNAGLGLSTAYGIITGHGGHIEATSRPDHGTCFMVYLPAAPRAAERAADQREPECGRGTGTVLLVDDEAAVLETSAELLEHSGFTVMKAADGNDALAIYRRHVEAIDLVVLDMILPGMESKTLYQRMREINPAVKVLLSSGFPMDEQAQALLLQGCVGFLQKPYDFKVMCSTLRRILASGK